MLGFHELIYLKQYFSNSATGDIKISEVCPDGTYISLYNDGVEVGLKICCFFFPCLKSNLVFHRALNVFSHPVIFCQTFVGVFCLSQMVISLKAHLLTGNTSTVDRVRKDQERNKANSPVSG